MLALHGTNRDIDSGTTTQHRYKQAGHLRQIATISQTR